MKKYLLPVFLLFVVFLANAQRVSFDLSFLAEADRDEWFYADPHYDGNGRVEYYSLEDNVRIYYMYDSDGNIVRKDFYSLNDFHYEWVLVQSVVCDYEAGRLREERVYVSPSVDTNRLTLPKLEFIWVKQFAYNADARTETITAYSPAFGHHGLVSERDTVTVVRYFDESGLVSKTYIREKWMNHMEGNNYHFFAMQLYTYGSHSRLVRVEKYRYKEHLPEWTLSTVSEIEHSNGRTVYSFYSAPAPKKVKLTEDDGFGLLGRHRQYMKEEKKRKAQPDEDEKMSFIVVDPGKLETEPDKLVYTISVDDKQRITARDVAVNGVTFIQSSYHYDGRGRTSVTHEASEMNRALNLVSYPWNYDVEYDPGRIVVPFAEKYSAAYTDADCLDFRSWKRAHRAELILSAEKEYCYAHGLLFSSVTSKEYTEKGDVFEEERAEFTYSADGQSGEYIQYRQDYELDNSSGMSEYVRKEQPSAKMLFGLDENNRRVNREKYFYNRASQDWELYEEER